ncbi:MAG: class I SAM-dependent methyltransferase [Thermoleophilaceae bacterium]
MERRFYSPVPDLEALPDDVFDRESELTGIHLGTAAHLAFAESHLAPYVRELDDHPRGFPFANDYYAAGDAHLTYAMVRHLRPARVLELGSGYSTLVMAMACESNAAEGAKSTYTAYDPYPTPLLADPPAGLTAYHSLPAQEVPLGEFTALGAGDVLFVDTSHTVKLGGDVNRVVLDVLPRLAAGVHVHFHDIWLPFEYHPELVRNLRLFWAEQYLLQAFLAMNHGYEVVLATHAARMREPDRFRALLPAWSPDLYPTSFWIRRCRG